VSAHVRIHMCVIGCVWLCYVYVLDGYRNALLVVQIHRIHLCDLRVVQVAVQVTVYDLWVNVICNCNWKCPVVHRRLLCIASSSPTCGDRRTGYYTGSFSLNPLGQGR
jgi:hypothetical protein